MTLEINPHGHKIKMMEREGKIGRSWKAGKPYEEPLLEHIYQKSYLGAAVDAGANFGNHTLYFSVVCGLDVHAFEPLQYPVLVENLTLNLEALEKRSLEVYAYRAALGEMECHARHVGKGTLETVDGEGDVEVKTLDSYNLDNISVIKADVEDMEAEVLAGSVETLERCKPDVYAEEHEGYHESIASVLEPLGYRMIGTHNDKGSRAPVGEWTCL